MIYLDNSASSLIKPPEVIQAVKKSMLSYTANPGRSGHALAIKTALEIERTRDSLREFVNADKSEHIIFTQNCTDALNLAILGSIRPNSHIICTINEHNSVLRPLYELKDKLQIEISVARPSTNGVLTVKDIIPHIKPNTTHIIVNHISNVDGCRAQINDIGELCATNCITFIVDAAQSGGHINLDMQKSHIDMLALAPHKGLFAPQGIGVLALSVRAKLSPIRYGGTGTNSISLKQPEELPESLESGTLSTPAIMGLNAGVNFVRKNFHMIIKKVDDLSTYLNFELRKIQGVKVYTSGENGFGVIAFNIKNLPSTGVAEILNEKFKVCVRSGLHCAPLKHKDLGTTQQGAVRASLSYFNTFTECEKFVKAVAKISKH